MYCPKAMACFLCTDHLTGIHIYQVFMTITLLLQGVYTKPKHVGSLVGNLQPVFDEEPAELATAGTCDQFVICAVALVHIAEQVPSYDKCPETTYFSICECQFLEKPICGDTEQLNAPPTVCI